MVSSASPGLVEGLLLAIAESSPSFKFLSIITALAFIYFFFARPDQSRLFPKWAPLEIAGASYVLSNGGLLLRI